MRGNIDSLKYIVNNGVNIHSKNKEGMTPLHYACKHEHLDIIKYLIESGADILALNKDKKMPNQLIEDDVECNEYINSAIIHHASNNSHK